MSYILNALRKSEKERQAVEPDAITDRIVIEHTARQRSTTSLVAALVAINVAILAYFLGFAENKTPAAPETVSVKPKEINAAEVKATVKDNKQILKERLKELKAKANNPALMTPAPRGANSQAASEPAKPATTKKAPTEIKKVVNADKAAANPEKPREPALTARSIEPNPPVEPTIPEGGRAVPKIEAQLESPALNPLEKTAKAPPRSAAPFLDELPYEFQRELPLLPINVYSYADAANERFVMIDMVKYLPGQRIKDILELKDIQSDGILVNYKGRTFKIRRP